MNTGGDKMASLIDIASEDDLLIDSHLDRASFDLRLSIAYDAVKTPKSHGFNEFKSRQSLAWDSAFFTSAGILDLRELSLVNEGFKNPEDHRRKICEKGSLACKLASGEGEAKESFMEFRVSGKHNLQSSKNNNTSKNSLASRTRVKYGQVHQIVNQESSRSSEMSAARKQGHHLPPYMKPSTKVQTRSTGHVLSPATTKPATPRSAFQKNASLAYTGTVSSNPGKRWLSQSLDIKGDNWKKIRGGLDDNVAHVSDIEGNRKPPHHENNQSEAGNKVQLQSSMKQNAAKGKRSASPLPRDVINSSKKPSRLCMPSQRLGIFEMDQSATRSAKRVPLLRSISPEPRGRGLKKGERKTNSHSLTKKTHPVGEDDEKENMSIHGGPAKKEYVDITNMFDGLAIEPKGAKRKKVSTSRHPGSAPPLRLKGKQSNRVSAVKEAGTKSPSEARDSAFRRSAFTSLV